MPQHALPHRYRELSMYVTFTVIKSIHEQTHSAMPDAPVRPYAPTRQLIRDVVRLWRERRTPDRPVVQLKVIPGDLCQAELRDRGTTPAGVARAC
ncbi:hypothetical protein [Kribbella sindirgiensis]|uniref:Uncharacterized protein n=1 Tax=Kribbella sindirgiensis TaxID=1124744 RepID=A0A4R0JF36_9ACTN|nr:hypothetical protein [Kribbella sindirgiensis]TCC43128.1 hypothetical protein E0H50_01165 [Kribbella sindirgiensis]